MKLLHTTYYIPHTKQGFTLVELVVSIGIFVVITSIILVSGRSFNNSIFLSNLSYEIALSVREAQVFGLSVRSDPGASVTTFGYGVYVSESNNTEYILFADENDNGRYDGSSEALEQFTITRGNSIDRFCTTGTGGQECSDTSSLSALHITFRRPDPDARIETTDGASSPQSATIHIASPGGASRSVVVSSTGQISVVGN